MMVRRGRARGRTVAGSNTTRRLWMLMIGRWRIAFVRFSFLPLLPLSTCIMVIVTIWLMTWRLVEYPARVIVITVTHGELRRVPPVLCVEGSRAFGLRDGSISELACLSGAVLVLKSIKEDKQ